MLRSNAAVFGRLLRIGDYGVAGSITLGAMFLRGAAAEEADPFRLLVFAIAGTLAFPNGIGLMGLYVSQRREPLGKITAKMLRVGCFVAVVLMGTTLILGRQDWLQLAAAIVVVQFLLLTSQRLIVHSLLRMMRRRGRNTRHIVVIGTGRRAGEFATAVAENPSWGISIMAFLDEANAPRCPAVPQDSLGSLDAFAGLVKRHSIDEVVVAVPRSKLILVGPVAAECALIGVPLTVLSDLFSDMLPASRGAFYGRQPVLQFGDVAYGIPSLFAKRCVDLLLGSILLILVSPIIAAAMLAIRLTSTGPVLYRQIRLGRHGRPFTLLKLRTMVLDAESQRERLLPLNEAKGPVFKMRHDPRVTPVGRFLRRWSIDETPQLVNVIRGDMSLVGPRPPLAHEVDLYESRHRRRISVRPGLTCLWQVSGRSRIPFAEWMELDLRYVDHWTLPLDFWILLRTPLAVLRKDGAY